VVKKTSLLSKHILIKEIKKPEHLLKRHIDTEPMNSPIGKAPTPSNGHISSTMFANSPYNRDMENVIIIPR
jgi:hypothetical protein